MVKASDLMYTDNVAEFSMTEDELKNKLDEMKTPYEQIESIIQKDGYISLFDVIEIINNGLGFDLIQNRPSEYRMIRLVKTEQINRLFK